MDSLTMSVIGLIVSIVMALFGMVFKRLNMLDTRLRQAPSREEVRELVQDKLAPMEVMQREMKEDVKDIKRNIERLLDQNRNS